MGEKTKLADSDVEYRNAIPMSDEISGSGHLEGPLMPQMSE